MENGLQNFILAIMPLPEISLTDKCTRLENLAPAAQKGKNVQMNIQGYVVSSLFEIDQNSVMKYNFIEGISIIMRLTFIKIIF